MLAVYMALGHFAAAEKVLSSSAAATAAVEA